MFKRPLLQVLAVILFLTGPYLSTKISPSVNEQPAIWCFYSVIQTVLFAIVIRYKELYKCAPPLRIHHAGHYGEQPLTYMLDKTTTMHTNGFSNGTNGFSNGTSDVAKVS